MRAQPVHIVFALAFGVLLSACGSLTTNPAASVPDGYYTLPANSEYSFANAGQTNKARLNGKTKIFLSVSNDTLYISPTDTTATFPGEVAYIYPFTNGIAKSVVTGNHFDVDVFTTPFKFRATSAGIPAQLTTNFNASFYGGYRFDYYTVKSSRLRAPVRFSKVNRIGFGIGAFAGLGATSIIPEYVKNTITYEYDAVTINYGLALLIGYKQVNTGISVGFDYLTDNNGKHWIYQNKPWLGLFIGFNLN